LRISFGAQQFHAHNEQPEPVPRRTDMIVSNATLYKKLVSKPTTEIENRYSGTGNKKHKHKLKLKDNKRAHYQQIS